jgi:hypothetical protein
MSNGDPIPDAPPPPAQPDRRTWSGAFVDLLHPIPLTILIILNSVLALIAANVLDWDRGTVLSKMADHEYARGLITYLFAVTTIGTAVVLVMAALTGKMVHDEAYQRGKEILALLLGVFGTIVGFYFGSEAHAIKAGEGPLNLTQPLLSATTGMSGTTVRVTAYASGGDKPYAYEVKLDEGDLKYPNPVDFGGWISTEFTIPVVNEVRQFTLQIGIRDSTGKTVIKESVITATPPKGP